MKVYNLCCANEHHFEGWFASEQAFLSQQARKLVSCPVCADVAISRLPSAPRLNLSAGETASPRSDTEQARQVQGAFMKMMRAVMDNTEDVGERFAEEARRMHYDEVPHRNIRGQATAAQARELQEEGIEVVALPIPTALKEPLQ